MWFRSLLVLSLLTSPLLAQDWTRFRGPNGSGVYDGIKLPATIKDFVWKVPLAGSGHSSPVLWKERLFTTSGLDDGTRVVQCLASATGKQLWRRDFPGQKLGMHKDNSVASSTPAVTAEHLVLCWANAREFLVQALDHDGKELWKTDLGPFKAGHGFGASPIVHDGLVIVPNDQEGESNLVGLELASGKIRWQIPRKTRSHYATPVVYARPGLPAQIIFASWEHGITSVEPTTGKIAWEQDVFDKGHTESSIASPVVAGERIVASCGWLGIRHEIVTLQMKGVQPRPQDPVLYRLDKTPLVPTPLVKDDLLFAWSDRGVVSCVDVVTGKEHWRERVPGNFYSSPVWAGGKLYCPSREGDLIVLAADKKFAQLAVTPLGEGTHSTPALAHGKMFVRTFRQLICLGE